MDENENIPYQIDFSNGRVVSGRWKVLSRIGTGAYGVVYSVQDIQKQHLVAALKVELNQEQENSMLKIEFEVLNKLQERPYTIRLYGAGKRTDYSFIVLTLCGADLAKLKSEKKIAKFTESTIYRVGVHALYAIKQLHEVGYVHRDIKPQNFVIGGTEKDNKQLYLIDFGMVRHYAVLEENAKADIKKWFIRKPRKKVSLRGTLRYCSINVHKRMEQGRADDIVSLVYMLAEMRFALPWQAAQREERLIALKEAFINNVDLNKLEGMRDILAYLNSCNYADRPDYKFVYTCMMDVIRKKKIKFSDLYDWEDEPTTYTPPKKEDTPPAGSSATSPTNKAEEQPPPQSPAGNQQGDTGASLTDTNNSAVNEPVSGVVAIKESGTIIPTDAREMNCVSSANSAMSAPMSQSPFSSAGGADVNIEKSCFEPSVMSSVTPPTPDTKEKPPGDKTAKKKKSRKDRNKSPDNPEKAPTIEEDLPATGSVITPKKTKSTGSIGGPGDKSARRAKRESANRTPPISGSNKEKSLYLEFNKTPKKDPNQIEEDAFPTAVPWVFDFKAGDVPSGTSASAAHRTPTESKNSARDKTNSTYGAPT
uniref:non-specific serine/threonine protein kinase n=1 Tax=Panagrellus redivivus TaxID=6233 RepID=A0A7E4VI74_PANRE